MTAVILLAVVVAGAAGGLLIFRLRAVEREQRRLDALAEVAVRLDGARVDLPARVAAPAPVPSAAPRSAVPNGRAALVDAVTEAVARSRADGTRLAVAVIAGPDRAARVLADDVERVAGPPAYVVGPRDVAFIVDGSRAEALAAIARVQATTGAQGHAVELERGEDAVDLLARALGSGTAGA